MLFWILVAILTAVVAAILLLPLLRGARATAPERAGEVAVYRDQLSELDRDRAQGLISSDEADYARAEIGRRLIAVSSAGASERAVSPSVRRRRFAELLVVVVLPGIGLCLYLMTGSPELPAQPLQARLDNPGDDIGILVTKAERHLAQYPEDGAGWDLLAPIYFKTQRLGDAELAYRNALRLLGPSATRYDGLAEVLIAGADGIVTADARAALDLSLTLDPANPRTRYYLALALEQGGEAEKARAAFTALAADSPVDAPWLPLVNDHIARNGGAVGTGVDTAGNPPAAPLGGPTQQDVAAADQMSGDDRRQIIEGMVASLAAKLKGNPNSLDGWLRLMRSYGVLNQPDEAAQALKTGLATFPADSDEGKQLLAAAAAMGLSTEGVAP